MTSSRRIPTCRVRAPVRLDLWADRMEDRCAPWGPENRTAWLQSPADVRAWLDAWGLDDLVVSSAHRMSRGVVRARVYRECRSDPGRMVCCGLVYAFRVGLLGALVPDGRPRGRMVHGVDDGPLEWV